MKIRWSSDAEDDRDEIRDYIATENPRAALRVDSAIGKAVERLREFPRSGRPGLVPDAREIVAYHRYRVVYEIRDNGIWIVAVRHTPRQWPPVRED